MSISSSHQKRSNSSAIQFRGHQLTTFKRRIIRLGTLSCIGFLGGWLIFSTWKEQAQKMAAITAIEEAVISLDSQAAIACPGNPNECNIVMRKMFGVILSGSATSDVKKLVFAREELNEIEYCLSLADNTEQSICVERAAMNAGISDPTFNPKKQAKNPIGFKSYLKEQLDQARKEVLER